MRILIQTEWFLLWQITDELGHNDVKLKSGSRPTFTAKHNFDRYMYWCSVVFFKCSSLHSSYYLLVLTNTRLNITRPIFRKKSSQADDFLGAFEFPKWCTSYTLFGVHTVHAHFSTLNEELVLSGTAQIQPDSLLKTCEIILSYITN